MRTRSQAVALAVAVIATLTLCGCVPPSPPVIPTAVPTATPVFASDADALAAAKKAFTSYLRESDVISDVGGADPQRIAPFVTKKWLSSELKSYAKLEKSGDRFTGAMAFDEFKLQSRVVNQHQVAAVVTYVCVDVSNTRLLDPSGVDITSPSRQDKYAVVATFESGVPASADLLFGGSVPWSGRSFCS
jgi:hypothetical protein